MIVESHSEKQQIKLSGLGKRGTTLDFFEFMEVLKYLEVYPALLTKTEASKIFREANESGSRPIFNVIFDSTLFARTHTFTRMYLSRELQHYPRSCSSICRRDQACQWLCSTNASIHSEEADENASEMDWTEFKGIMHTLCNLLEKEGFLGVSKADLVPKASDREEAWKASNGVVLRGSGSRLTAHRSEFLNCIQGCVVKRGSTAELSDCKFLKCGRDRADAAALVVSGKGSAALCHSCEIDGSDHHGVKAEGQGQVELVNTRILHVKQQGVLAVGRETKVDLEGCLLQNAGLCGLRANQNGCIKVVNSEILRCYDAGILSSFLGTKIEVKGGVKVEGNGGKHESSRGIVAENEGCVFVSGKNEFLDDLIAYGHARIEEPNRRHTQNASVDESEVTALNVSVLICKDAPAAYLRPWALKFKLVIRFLCEIMLLQVLKPGY